MRVDKLSLAALEATLRLYRAPHDPLTDIPVLRMLTADPEVLAKSAKKLAKVVNAVAGADATLVSIQSQAGGGSLPGLELESSGVQIAMEHLSAQELATALRSHNSAIIGRIIDDRFTLDVRTLMDDDFADIADVIASIATGS